MKKIKLNVPNEKAKGNIICPFELELIIYVLNENNIAPKKAPISELVTFFINKNPAHGINIIVGQKINILSEIFKLKENIEKKP
jgi:hypothetical protein